MIPLDLWINPAHHGKGPGDSDITEASEDVTKRHVDRANRSLADSFSHGPAFCASGALPVMSSQQSEIRAQAMRARLTVLAEVCGVLGVNLPMRKLLAPAMGATPRQMDRWMAILIAEGVVERRTWKNGGRAEA